MLSDYGSHCLSAMFIDETPSFALADGTVRRMGAEVDCLRVHAAASLAAVPVAGEDALLTSGEDGRVCRTETNGRCSEVGVVPRKWITSIAQSRDRLAYAVGKTVWLHSSSGMLQMQHVRSVKGICLTVDGTRLAVAQQDGITVHDLEARGEAIELPWNDINTASTFSPDGRFLVVAAQKCFLHGWRLSDRKHFRMLGYQGRVEKWAWSLDGAFLATTGAAAAIVWPFAGDDGPMGGSALEVAPRTAHAVTAVAWRPDSSELAVGYDDGLVQLASADDGASVHPLNDAGQEPITSLAWSRNGRRIAFGGAAGKCGVLAVAA